MYRSLLTLGYVLLLLFRSETVQAGELIVHDGNMLMQRKRGSVFEKTNIETYLKNKCLQLKVPVQMNSYSLKDNVQFEVEDDVLKVLQ